MAPINELFLLPASIARRRKRRRRKKAKSIAELKVQLESSRRKWDGDDHGGLRETERRGNREED
ncbi:hypothetical protein Csa_007942 [Cucumis sativus]|uniref:Uncharacterized protein n=1 Tax=Cucumis sativus TaxID=3659 RepID=A0A0A0KN97_CUCSA|nr:hypothetical protein Csa_007942 [Cucumis sativus]